MTDKEFVDDMRMYRIDHLPDGYPAVQTHQIDRLINIIDGLTRERDEAKKTGGYTCHVCGALRAECDIMKRTSDDVARRAAAVAGSQDAIGKTPAQVATAILREFGLSD